MYQLSQSAQTALVQNPATNEIANAIITAKNNTALFAKRTRTRILKLEEKIERIKIHKVHSIINTPHSDGSITNEEKFHEEVNIERRVKETLVALVDEKYLAGFPRGFVAADSKYIADNSNAAKNISDRADDGAANSYSPVIDAEFTDSSGNHSGKSNLLAKNNITNYAPLLSYTLLTPSGQKVTYELLENSFAPQSSDYEQRRDQALQDFTNLVPDKIIDIQPLPIGLYGFTYLNTNYMAITDQISFHKQRETMVHEAIHTQDEYETRQITAWMLSKDSKYAVRINVKQDADKK